MIIASSPEAPLRIILQVITEHVGGVKVTGGQASAVVNGITGESGFNIIDINTNSEQHVRFKHTDNSGLQTELNCGRPENALSSTANVTGCFTRVDINDNVVKGATYYGYRTQGNFDLTTDNLGDRYGWWKFCWI